MKPTTPLTPTAKVRRQWPFLVSVDASGRVTQTLPVKTSKPAPKPDNLPEALF